MNIVVACATLSKGKGGMEKVASDLANYLSKKHSVFLVYNVNSDSEVPSYSLDQNVVRVPWDTSSLKEEDYIHRLKGFDPFVFIVFGATCAIRKYIDFSEACKAKLIVSEHSNPERVLGRNWAEVRGISKYEAAWEREYYYSKADFIHVLLPEYGRSLSSDFDGKVVSFPNCFDVLKDRFPDAKENRLINIGGMKVNKNILPLIDAFSLISNRFPAWSIHVFSSIRGGSLNAYHDEVFSKIDSLGLKDRVFIRGEVDDIYKEYVRSDIHVITSFSEGLSNAVAEAMCCGVATVGIKDVPGVDGVISHERNGILVDRGDLVNNLADALAELMSSEEKVSRLGEQALRDAAIFESENVFKRWDALLAGLQVERDVANREGLLHYQRVSNV